MTLTKSPGSLVPKPLSDSFASLDDRAFFHELKRRGAKIEDGQIVALPKTLSDDVVAKSKKGPLGTIKLHRMSGLKTGLATRTVRQFEQSTSRDELINALDSVREELNEEEKKLLEVMKLGSKKSLARLMAETKTEPTQVIKKYAQGCIEIGRIQSAIEAHKNMPSIIRTLVKHALERVDGVCKVCGGTGLVAESPVAHKTDLTCPSCDGSGKHYVTSEHFEFANEKLLEVTHMIQKGGPTVNVNQQVAVKVQGGGIFERMVSASDALLYGQVKPVEAEVVYEETEKPEEASNNG